MLAALLNGPCIQSWWSLTADLKQCKFMSSFLLVWKSTIKQKKIRHRRIRNSPLIFVVRISLFSSNAELLKRSAKDSRPFYQLERSGNGNTCLQDVGQMKYKRTSITTMRKKFPELATFHNPLHFHFLFSKQSL
jgi:hypothetical protein